MSIKYDERDWVDGVCTVTPKEHAVGRVLFICSESIKMSDYWEYAQAAHYVNDDGRETYSIIGGYGDYAVTATVDATEEAYVAFYNKRVETLILHNTERSEIAGAKIRKGDLVRITKGRTGKGQVGLVFWEGESSYRTGWKTVDETKYGIALSDRKVEVEKNGRKFMSYADVVFVYDRNCEKAEPVPVDHDHIRKISEDQARKETNELRARADHLNKKVA